MYEKIVKCLHLSSVEARELFKNWLSFGKARDCPEFNTGNIQILDLNMQFTSLKEMNKQ